VRVTVAQALVRFLANQYVERDGSRHRFFAGCFGIFGHGNVAALGRALAEAGDDLRYYMARNEQAMVHAAVGYARMRDRLEAFACTSSIGPGATNMVTGAAVATTNRIPVLLLPGDVFATRRANPVLQELEDPASLDRTVNDTLRPVSRYFDRIWRPEQLPAALMQALRVLTSPSDTGAVTIALPEDVQAETWDWPPELFAPRTWHIPRPVPEPATLERVTELVHRSERPLIVAGGGVIYSGATSALAHLCEVTGIPVGETQAGKGSLPSDHSSALGGIGATGTTAANAVGRHADLVMGIGTRWSDFTTASHSLFQDPSVTFVNVNVAGLDAHKLSGLPVVADARVFIAALTEALVGWAVPAPFRASYGLQVTEWRATVDAATAAVEGELPSQTAVIGALQSQARPGDVIVGAAGSLPGDLHKLWRPLDPKGYHVEYAYSCMGYEIAAGLGVKMAAPEREVFVLVGDGSYLMMNGELVTALQERLKLIVVLVDNHGFASIGALSESVGANRFGTQYRYRADTGMLDGDVLPVDLAANAASLGAQVLRPRDVTALHGALAEAREADRTTVVLVETDPLVPSPDSEAWWDVPVAQVSSTTIGDDLLVRYEKDRSQQRPYLRSSE
jgi:3D-(3,5/4)-trihydroxycyclohexane-1,2-dione acylhydrolase (decyclizing)